MCLYVGGPLWSCACIVVYRTCTSYSDFRHIFLLSVNLCSMCGRKETAPSYISAEFAYHHCRVLLSHLGMFSASRRYSLPSSSPSLPCTHSPTSSLPHTLPPSFLPPLSLVYTQGTHILVYTIECVFGSDIIHISPLVPWAYTQL